MTGNLNRYIILINAILTTPGFLKFDFHEGRSMIRETLLLFPLVLDWDQNFGPRCLYIKFLFTMIKLV